MKIGIVGSEGIVGQALKFGFEKVGHDILCHDIKLKTSIIPLVNNAEIVFVCVPTGSKEDYSCDTSIVEDVIKKINECRKKEGLLDQIIVIKSTVVPGTTEKLQEKYKDMKLAFVPEFLRERVSISDFTENHDLCVIGTHSEDIYEKIKKAHGYLPKKFIRLTPTEAEFVKYFTNAFNATRIVFANSFYEICQKNGVDYTNVKNAATNIGHIPHHYLECNQNMRGFAGICLPKDLKVLVKMSECTGVKFFNHILTENDKYKKTVFNGMRK